MTNTSSRPADIRPKSKLAIVSFVLAVLAFVVAFVGVFRGPQMASGYWLIPPTVIALMTLDPLLSVAVTVYENAPDRSERAVSVRVEPDITALTGAFALKLIA